MKAWNPTSGFVVWGPDKGSRNPHGIWPWRPEGFDYKTCTRLGETKTSVWKSTNKTMYTPRLRGMGQWLYRKLNQNYMLVLGCLLWRYGSAGLTKGVGDWQQLSGKILLGINPLGDSPSGSLHKPLTSSIRGQTDAARTTTPQGLKQNHISESQSAWKSRKLYPSWWDKIKLQKNN